MHHSLEATQLTGLILGENIIIACSYFAISWGVALGIWRNREVGIDPLIVVVALIFLSCGFGHSFHGLQGLGLPYSLVLQTLADGFTVIIALRFLSYYRSFDLLARFSQIFTSKIQLEKKNELLEITTKEAEQKNKLLEIAMKEVEQKNELLEVTMTKLKQTYTQLVQQEKMSSLGQLVAGVAHEINNPINFIHGNLTYVEQYADTLLNLLEAYQNYCPTLPIEIPDLSEEDNLEFIQADLPKIISSMKIGTERIRQIVLSLRNFSRIDEAELKAVNIHEGIDSTLTILEHRLKAKPDFPEIRVLRDYCDLPNVECFPSSLNQVFMNILANAIDALEEVRLKPQVQLIQEDHVQIIIRTSIIDARWIQIAIADNGVGVSEDVLPRIFDPFFTTKAIGKGTGIGMSISHQIIVEKHRGKLTCFSTLGKGTEFLIEIPLKQEIKVVTQN
ncbi:sensor histidine kinase [Calothrix sp. PCC 6303]|uniref:sensor histidine kinase n=1 Tax=Calothrix sp. PCC 6303 TaxID=1170562 RepID=UPI0002A00A2D|nr:ATP-binding protein [Calothrix sp. PCC 6303]AFZ00769.1 integral membrane sensor signal transduction histidine kinase [Calothrix sp. PCC 6303]